MIPRKSKSVPNQLQIRKEKVFESNFFKERCFWPVELNFIVLFQVASPCW